MRHVTDLIVMCVNTKISMYHVHSRRINVKRYVYKIKRLCVGGAKVKVILDL